MIPERFYVNWIFQKRLGYKLNIEEPTTFNEKIQWIKLKDKNPLKVICTDKYSVRKYIKSKIGDKYLIPLHFYTENPCDITPENLPDIPCIIKTNHVSGDVIIVRDKSTLDFERVRQKLKILLRKNHFNYTKEWQYKNIKPCILVEKLLLDENSKIPYDYKFHCFNGKVAFIQVDLDRLFEHKRILYDPEWNIMNFQLNDFKQAAPLEKPKMFDEMKTLAEDLARDFLLVRVDFFNLGEVIYFGELTFHPGSGWSSFSPIEWDNILGSLLQIK
jgi:hypothetical protein